MNHSAIAAEPAELIVPAKLEAAVSGAGLDAAGAMSLRRAFAGHFDTFGRLALEAKAIRFDQPEEARSMRLLLKGVRTSAERTRKLLKEDSLRRGKAIDGINAVLEYELVPIEQAMEAIEKAEERAKAQRIATLRDTRAAELKPYGNPAFYDLGNMPAEAFAELLGGMKAAVEAKEKAQAQEAADRAERERAAARAKEEADKAAEATRAALRAENERLAKVAAEERAKREAQEAAAAKERAEQEQAAAAERARRDEADRIAKAEADRLAAELARIEKARADQVAAEAAAAKKAKAAPDREKLAALAAGIRALPVPTLATEAGAALVVRITEQAAKFAAWVESEAARL